MTIISTNHQLIFIHIPKCGGSSVEEAFQPHVHWGDFVVGSTRHGEVIGPIFNQLYGVGKHTSAKHINDVLGDVAKNFSFVCTVREPKKIVESWYKFTYAMVDRHTHYTNESLEQIRKKASRFKAENIDTSQKALVYRMKGIFREALLNESFAAYLDCIVDDRWSTMLSKMVNDERGNCLVQHIFKCEKITECQTFFRQHTGIKAFAIPHYNKGKPVPTPWPKGLLQRFYDIAAPEYERFGYEIDS